MVEACTPNDMVGGMLNAAIVVPITMMMMNMMMMMMMTTTMLMTMIMMMMMTCRRSWSQSWTMYTIHLQTWTNHQVCFLRCTNLQCCNNLLSCSQNRTMNRQSCTNRQSWSQSWTSNHQNCIQSWSSNLQSCIQSCIQSWIQSWTNLGRRCQRGRLKIIFCLGSCVITRLIAYSLKLLAVYHGFGAYIFLKKFNTRTSDCGCKGQET